MAEFETKKGIADLAKWDTEHIFYNPLFRILSGNKEKTLKPTKYCDKNKIYTFQQLLQEKIKEIRKIPYKKELTKILSDIQIFAFARKEDILIRKNGGEELKFTEITQKILYEEAIFGKSKDHISEIKWVDKLSTSITWEDVWKSVHSCLITNHTKTIIWEQIHLNYYTQYSYNKWHEKNDKCFLCDKNPESIFHIILHCDFTNALWNEIEPILKELHPKAVTDEEKAFGIIERKQTPGILIRNWITYLLRECISKEERLAYHLTKKTNSQNIKRKFNNALELEIILKILRYKNENNLLFFEKLITHGNILCSKIADEEYDIRTIFPDV